MQRHIYRLLAMILLFIGSMVLMISKMEEITIITAQSVTEMSEASFPTVVLQNRDREMNPLHGYSVNMDPDVLRESLTPLDGEQAFFVVIEEHETRVKRLLYEVWDTFGNNMLDSGSISALEEREGGKAAKVKIRAELAENEEYFVKLTVVTATGKKVRFYTRVKYVPEDHLQENLDFVMDFHGRLFDKEEAEGIRPYLESDHTMENHSLAYVNIHSSFDVVTWGELAVEKATEPVPVLTENNANTTAVQLKYLVAAETADGVEEYFVTEFYRVQYTPNAMYLLAYERTMEAVFNPENASLSKNDLKLGIMDPAGLELVSSGENSRVCFVRERELWYYSLAENQAVRVFSFRGEGSLDGRELYDQHDIRILNMDDAGNIDFIVFGYLNRGVYEGRTAIVLYHFYSGENRIEEQVYLPLETSYQVLKEDLDRLSYVSADSVFYFSIYNSLYAYSTITKKVEAVAEDITEDSYLVFPGKSRVAWQGSGDTEQSGRLVIMDLETRRQVEIEAPEGRVIGLLGGIDDNMIYGIANKDDIIHTPDGTTRIPMARVYISDKEGNVLKEYRVKGYYVYAAETEDNVIRLLRMRKRSDGTFVEAEDDHILNYLTTATPPIAVSERVTDLALAEQYVTLPAGHVMDGIPTRSETVNTVIHEETTLRLSVSAHPPKRYYTYIYGEITGIYQQAAAAIREANDKMGLVVDQANQIVWERGAKARTASVDNIRMISSGSIAESVPDCLRMLLQRKYLSVGADEIRSRDGGMSEILDEYLSGTAVNLTGAELDEVLYFTGRGRPVIAMLQDGRAVLIIGYDEYNVEYLDPVEGTTVRVSLTQARARFEEAGNMFVSYTQ